MDILTTSSEEVRRLFGCTEAAARRFEDWLVDERRKEVVPVVMNHVTKVPYELRPDDVREVCSRTAHALGQVRYLEIKHVRDAHDWSPAFSFSHLFHFRMEQVGRMPTWGEFIRFYSEDERGKIMLGNALEQRYWELRGEGHGEKVAWDALHWRVGNAYYGLVRDVFTVVQLRDRGLDVRCHPLADTLFRTDAWVGRTIISLLVKNQRYRVAGSGRKTRPHELYAGAKPEFLFEDVELDAADKFGCVHLPSEQAITDLAERLNQQDSGSSL